MIRTNLNECGTVTSSETACVCRSGLEGTGEEERADSATYEWAREMLLFRRCHYGTRPSTPGWVSAVVFSHPQLQDHPLCPGTSSKEAFCLGDEKARRAKVLPSSGRCWEEALVSGLCKSEGIVMRGR